MQQLLLSSTKQNYEQSIDVGIDPHFVAGDFASIS